MPRTSSHIRLLMKSFAERPLKSDEPSAHLFQRIGRIPAELQRLDAGTPPKIIVNRFIDALPEDYVVLKKQFGGVNVGQTNVLSACMARFSENAVSSKDSGDDVLVTFGGWKEESKGKGIRSFL